MCLIVCVSKSISICTLLLPISDVYCVCVYSVCTVCVQCVCVFTLCVHQLRSSWPLHPNSLQLPSATTACIHGYKIQTVANQSPLTTRRVPAGLLGPWRRAGQDRPRELCFHHPNKGRLEQYQQILHTPLDLRVGLGMRLWGKGREWG